MSSNRDAVESIQRDVLAAIARVSAVAHTTQDEPRRRATAWLHHLFVDVRGEEHLREAAAEALTLYAGMASFSDTGDAESALAVDRLGAELWRARTSSTP